MPNTLSIDQLEHVGTSLITIKGSNNCLGDLFVFQGKAFDPYYGMVPVSEDAADIHNKALDEAKLKGMDENCEIGQGGTFYLNNKVGVTTFSGTWVADYTLNPSQTVITFTRNGKTYRGRLSKKHDCFNFRRIS